jgi:hypothetical protein
VVGDDKDEEFWVWEEADKVALLVGMGRRLSVAIGGVKSTMAVEDEEVELLVAFATTAVAVAACGL